MCASAAQASGGLVIPQTLSQPAVKIGSPTLDNVQMNGDSDPPLPQDEPSIAESLDDPMNAVVRVDRPGWFADNPNANDNLPGKGHV